MFVFTADYELQSRELMDRIISCYHTLGLKII
jgi:hypothetical protein